MGVCVLGGGVTLLCMPAAVGTIVNRFWLFGWFLCKFTAFLQSGFLCGVWVWVCCVLWCWGVGVCVGAVGVAVVVVLCCVVFVRLFVCVCGGLG